MNRADADKSVKKVKLTLDELPFGTREDIAGMTHRVTKTLPENVTSSMLYKDIVKIAWPSLAELTLTSLVSMVDMIMVGGLGPWAIAAVGLATQPRFLMVTVIMALNVGATAHIARCRGAGDRAKANSFLKQSLLLCAIMSAVIGALGYAFSQPLIELMGAQEQAPLIGGTQYLQIQSLGFMCIGLTSTVTAALRGVGNSKTPMIYNMTANIVNVIFNYLLIEGNLGFPRMEVAGASLATFIGQAIAMVMAIISVSKKKNYLYVDVKTGFKPNWDQIRAIFKIGLPSMAEQLLMRIGIMLFSRSVANLGTTEYAAYQVAINIQNLSMMNGMGFATSATSLMGQSIGKNRPDMAQAYTSRCRRMGLYMSVVLILLFVFLGKEMALMYTDDATVVGLCEELMLIVAATQPFLASQFIVSGALRGAGDTTSVAIITVITTVIMRPILGEIAINTLGLGVVGAWYVLLLDQLLRSLLIMIRFNSGKWKKVFYMGGEGL